MKLKTERLLIRQFGLEDLDDLCEMLGDEQVMKSTGLRTIQSREQSQKLLRAWSKDPEIFAVCLSEKLMGWAMLKTRENNQTELGFMIARQFWGKGYATELAKALCSWSGKDLIAVTDRGNKNSQRVLEKSGFVFKAEKEKSIFYERVKETL